MDQESRRLRSIATSRSSRSRPTRSMRKSPRRRRACSPKSRLRKARRSPSTASSRPSARTEDVSAARSIRRRQRVAGSGGRPAGTAEPAQSARCSGSDDSEDDEARRRAAGGSPATEIARRWCGGSRRSTTSTSAQIQGTGLSGRVTKQDILGYIESGKTSVRPRAAVASRRSAVAVAARVASASASPARTSRVVPMSVMRKKIAEHMVLSAHTSPHVYSVYEVNFARVAALREKKKADYEAAGAKLTFTAFIAKVGDRRAARVPDRQCLDRRRQHRLQEGHQPRHRGRARQWAYRARSSETPTRRTCSA